MIKQAIADAIGYRGAVSDGPAFANACVEFEARYPGEWQYLSGKELKI